MATWNPQANELFLKALELHSAEDRQQYLDQACAGDTALRAEVDGLLAASERAGNFLESLAPLEVATAPEAPRERPGAVIGPYKLLEQIGEGGFGVVFMAEQTKPLCRKVALKVLKPGMDTRQVVARFEAERQALAIMDHPNIAKVLDGGATPAGRPYFVMELVKGAPITKFCDHNHLTPRQRLELFVSVCQAVQHAHHKGIIHRDLKPSNVLVTVHDTIPVVNVIDFGVAKALGQKLTDKTLFTGFAQMIGTPLYMSPEQAGQSGLDIDTRSDIYSLGVLLYELLTGTTPFTRERFQKAAYDEMLRIIREEEPPRPSTRLSESKESLPSISAQRQMEPAKLRKLVRGELDWIVMKSLEKDRNRRYETANGFARDVQRYLADEPVLACPPSALYRLRKFARRNKRALVPAAVLAVALLVAVGGVAWSVGWANRDRAARQAAVEQEASLALDEAERWHQQGKWAEALSGAKRAEGLLAGGDNVALRQRIEELRREIHRDVEMVQRLEAAWLHLDGPRAGKAFDFEAMDAAYLKAFRDYGIDVETLPAERAAELIRARPIRLELTQALDQWAWRWKNRKDKLLPLVRLADPDKWRNRVREALWAGQHSQALLGELAASDQGRTLPPATLCALGSALQQAGLIDDAVALLRDAQLRHPDDFWINYGLARALKARRYPRWEEVVRYFSAALALRPRSTATLFQLGYTLSEQGRADQALAYYRKLIDIDPKDAAAQNNLAVALEKVGRSDDALARYRKAVEFEPTNTLHLTNLGWALQRMGRSDEAIGYFRRAIAANPKYARAYRGLGAAFRATGQLDPSIASDRKASDLDPRDVGALRSLVETFQKAVELKPSDPRNHYDLGNTLARLGRWKEAAAAYDRGLALDATNLELWCNAAVLHAVADDVDAYRRICREMAHRFGVTNHLQILCCLLLPDAVSAADFERVQKLAEQFVGPSWLKRSGRGARNYMRTKALTEYRAGRYAEAVKWLERIASRANGDSEDAAEFAILSMARHRLGRTKEAQAALAQAKAIVARLPDPARGRPFGGYWRGSVFGWFMCRVAEDDMFTETLKQRIARVGADHPDTLHAMTDLANRYQRLGRYADAARLYEELLARQKVKPGLDHPDTLNTMLALAANYVHLARHTDAARLYEEALKQEKARPAANDDQLVNTMIPLAGCYDKLDRPADALKLYQEVLARRKAKLGSHHISALSYLRPKAQSLIKLDRGAEAIPLIDEFVERLSGKIAWGYIPEMLWLRVRHFEKTRDAAGCRTSAKMWEEQSETLSRFDLAFYYDAARCRAITAAVMAATDQSEKGARAAAVEADRAMTWLKKAVAIGYKDVEHLKTDPDLRALRGRKDFKKLVADLEAELRIAQVRSHHERGNALLSQGKLDEAITEFRKAIALDPKHLAAHLNLANTCARLGRWDQALAAMDKAAELAPGDPWNPFRAAALHLHTGDLAGYRRVCRDMMKRFGDTKDPGVADLAAKTCLLLPDAVADRDRVGKLADRTVTGDINNRWFLLTKALAENRAGRHAEAIQWLERFAPRAERGWPSEGSAFAVLALAQHQRGRREDALAALDQAERVVAAKLPDPADGRPFGDNWYDWLHCQVLLREAEGLLKPDEARLPFYRGSRRSGQGKWPEAEAEYRQAIRLRPSWYEATYRLAIALWEQGRQKDAQAAFQEARRLKPKQLAGAPFVTPWSDSDQWVVKGQELHQLDKSHVSNLFFGDPAWTDYDFEAEVEIIGGGSEVGVHFRASSRSDGLYAVVGAFGNTCHGVLGRSKTGAGAIGLVKGQSNKGCWYRLRVEARGERVKLFLDGKLLVTVDAGERLRGCVGLVTNPAQARFRNLKVTDATGEVLLEGGARHPPRAEGRRRP